jgi:hypothetical protein
MKSLKVGTQQDQEEVRKNNWNRLRRAGDVDTISIDSQPQSMREQTKANSPESVSLLDRALRDEWHTVVVLSSLLPDSMPVNCDFHTFHVVFNINDDAIVLADLDAWPWDHTVDGKNTAFNTVG